MLSDPEVLAEIRKSQVSLETTVKLHTYFGELIDQEIANQGLSIEPFVAPLKAKLMDFCMNTWPKFIDLQPGTSFIQKCRFDPHMYFSKCIRDHIIVEKSKQ